MRNVTLIALAVFTIAAPSIASAQNYGYNEYGRTEVKMKAPMIENHGQKVVKIDGPDRNHRPDIVFIDGKDRDNRFDKIIIKNDDYRPDYNRHKYYKSHHAHYNVPTKYYNRNQCGFGTVTYRMPNGRKVYDNVYMCNVRGEWVVVNR